MRRMSLWPPIRLLAASSLLLPALPAATQPAAPSGAAEPKVQRIVIEDDSVRIEELRVRGQTQRIVVKPKVGNARAYEIVPADGARDLSAGPASSRGAAGQRVWNVLSF